MSDFCTEIGISQMLEASDHDSIDVVLHFIEALVDPFCRNTKLAAAKKASTRYVSLVQFGFRREQKTC